MNKVSRSYQEQLLKALADPKEAAEYLNAAIEEGDPELFLTAVENVAQACHLKKQVENISLTDFVNILESAGLRFSTAE